MKLFIRKSEETQSEPLKELVAYCNEIKDLKEKLEKLHKTEFEGMIARGDIRKGMWCRVRIEKENGNIFYIKTTKTTHLLR